MKKNGALKVLFESPLNVPHIGVETFCTNALRELGCEVINFESWRSIGLAPPDSSGAIKTRHRRFSASKTIPFYKKVKGIVSEARFKNRIADVNPDVLFVLGGKNISTDVIMKIRCRFKLMTLCWFIDDPQLFSLSREFSYAYSMFFTDDPYSVRLYHQIGVKAYPINFGCDPIFHKKVELTEDEQTKYGSDVVFNGTIYPDRVSQLESIADLGLAIWGRYSESIRNNDKLWPCYRGDCTIDELVKIYNASKILINPHLGFGKPLEERGTWANLRVFEAAGSGIFQIVDNKPVVEECFRPGKEIMCFRSEDELRPLVKKYLADDNARETIADASQKRAYKDHTFVHRMRELFSYAGYDL